MMQTYFFFHFNIVKLETHKSMQAQATETVDIQYERIAIKYLSKPMSSSWKAEALAALMAESKFHARNI